MDTPTLLQLFAASAGSHILQSFLPNGCLAATAITIDVMGHYGRSAEPWEVCLQVDSDICRLDVGCFDPESPHDLGGHIVAIVDGAYLVDASFAQVRNACPALGAPTVFVGELRPAQPPPQDSYEFSTPWATVNYRGRLVFRDWRSLPDWRASPERSAAKRTIVSTIEECCARQNLPSPRHAT